MPECLSSTKESTFWRDIKRVELWMAEKAVPTVIQEAQRYRLAE